LLYSAGSSPEVRAPSRCAALREKGITIAANAETTTAMLHRLLAA
jgi:hypothetical protein